MILNTMMIRIAMKNTMTMTLALILLISRIRISQLATRSAAIVEDALTKVRHEQVIFHHLATMEEVDLYRRHLAKSLNKKKLIIRPDPTPSFVIPNYSPQLTVLGLSFFLSIPRRRIKQERFLSKVCQDTTPFGHRVEADCRVLLALDSSKRYAF